MRRLVVLPFPVAAAIVALAVAPAASAGTTFRAGTTYYAVGKRACKPPKKAGYAACDADIRVLVKKGTNGARAFEPAGGATGSATIGPAGGLTPSDLGTAYGLPTTGGSGQTVAIVDAYNDPNINADLQTFDTQYGLASCSTSNGCLTVVNETGGTALPPNDSSGWSVEESLDVEAVHSTCQGCKIALVEATSPANADLGAAENTAVNVMHATEVANSFGEPEADTSSAYQADFNHPGTVITAPTGDDGYYNYDCRFASSGCSPSSQPDIPAAYNTVVAVGGTSLYLGQGGDRQNETVWNDNGVKGYFANGLGSLGASGGGCSTLFSAPGWQTNLGVWPSTACGADRLDADVAAVADYLTGFDVYDSYTCASGCVAKAGWYTIGGTSLASPLIAGAYGLAGGAHGMSYPALVLYGHPGKAYDVTSGGNGYCDGEGAGACGNPNTVGSAVIDCDYTALDSLAAGDRACDALAGFDGPTGMGTPNGLGMFRWIGPQAKISGPTSIAHGTSGTWTATTTDPFPGGTTSSYTWMWGDGTTSSTTTGSASHTYSTAGSYTITLRVKDNYGVTGSATYAVSVT